ncbi:MAG: hypothetical protein K0S65_6616 [Labilithrix sp.]|nr:hypothetical protein [Labilithrix sp.]
MKREHAAVVLDAENVCGTERADAHEGPRSEKAVEVDAEPTRPLRVRRMRSALRPGNRVEIELGLFEQALTRAEHVDLTLRSQRAPRGVEVALERSNAHPDSPRDVAQARTYGKCFERRLETAHDFGRAEGPAPTPSGAAARGIACIGLRSSTRLGVSAPRHPVRTSPCVREVVASAGWRP